MSRSNPFVLESLVLVDRRPRRLAPVGLCAALLASLLWLPGTAAADEEVSAGDVVRGTLVQAWPEYEHAAEAADHAHEGPLSWIEPEVGAAVRVQTEDVEIFEVGATVKVEVGDEVRDAAADEGLEPAREVLAAEVLEPAPADAPVAEALPASWITNEVTVVMVVPAGGVRDSTALADVVNVVNGPVADFWSRESSGAVGVGVAAGHDWPATAYTASCSDPTALWNEAQVKSGFVAGPGKHLLLYLPRNSAGCSYGLAEVRSGPAAGGRLYVTDTRTSLIAHELGHNFSLGHSSAFQCDRSVDRGSCRVLGYGDYYDVMAASWDEVGSLNAPQSASLGFLPARTAENEGYLEVRVGGAAERTLHKFWQGNSDVRALKIVGAADGAVYWLEYRTAVGPDEWLADGTRNLAGLQSGVLLRRQLTRSDPTYGNDGSLLLDGTPSALAGWDSDRQSVLPLDTPMRVQAGGFTVTVRSATADQATVLVEGNASRGFPRDWTRSGAADVLAADPAGGFQLYPGSGNGGFLARRTIGSGWQSRDQLHVVGDWDGDSVPDLIARNPSNGDLWLYRGNGSGGFGSARVIGVGWSGFDAIFSPGDWNGDGPVDLLARARSDGGLYLYPGNGTGGFGAPSKVGYGWGGMTDLATTGDWDRNSVVDIVARDAAGHLYLYSGNGTGGFSGRRTIGVGWQIFTQITGPGDWDGDGHPDLLAQDGNGALFVYPGNGAGGFLARKQIGSGWTGFRIPD
jgi:hypothetical protein